MTDFDDRPPSRASPRSGRHRPRRRGQRPRSGGRSPSSPSPRPFRPRRSSRSSPPASGSSARTTCRRRKAKWPALRERYPGRRAASHRPAAVQQGARCGGSCSTSSRRSTAPSLAEALAKEIGRQGRAPRLFVQVNTGEEPQKGGVVPGEADAFLDALPRRATALPIDGLMCIPPADEPPSPHFALLAKIARRNGLPHPVDGHERRFRAGDPARRDPCARRQRDLRGALRRLRSELTHKSRTRIRRVRPISPSSPPRPHPESL